MHLYMNRSPSDERAKESDQKKESLGPLSSTESRFLSQYARDALKSCTNLKKEKDQAVSYNIKVKMKLDMKWKV